jgi:tetratricopeptide (TPR) repeat protein
MLRTSRSARHKSSRALISAAAMALVLSGAGVVGTAVSSVPALAQEGQTLTKDFQKVYQPVADAVNTTGDYAGAKAQVPGLLAAAKSDYDRFHAGNIILQLGAKASDKALQKQGLELMLASGQAGQNAGLLHYFLGGFAYDEQNYDVARQQLQASIDAGFAGNFAEKQDPWGLIAESYFKQTRYKEGFDFLRKTIDARSAAGQEIPQAWLERPLALAYQQKLPDEAAAWSALLVSQAPSKDNWAKALQVVAALNPSDKQAQLDLLRLMALTGSMSQRQEFESYIEAADPRIMANEVGRVLAAGKSAGVFSDGDPFYSDVKQVVDERAPKEQADAAQYAADAAGAADGKTAQNAGELYLALQDYPKAEEMLQLALTKGGIDKDTVLTRLGMAQVQQGKLDEAKATFDQISGPRATVARMWAAYVESRA